MKKNPFILFPASIVASFILLSPALYADAITWDAGGGNNAWSTLANWSDDAAPTADDVTFNAAGALASGTTNTVSASEVIASLSYNFEDAAKQHTTAIDASQTLTVAGDFLLAGSVTAASATNVSLVGSTGTLTVNGTSFQVGQPTPTAGSTTNILDMSGLGNFTANLGVGGTFRLGGNSLNTAGAAVTVILAANSSITADTLGVADKSGKGVLQTLKLGSVANTINANTLSVGPIDGRGKGNLSFNAGTGTLLLRAADGTSAVTSMNLVNNDFNHSATHTATVDFAGHSVDAKIDALNMAIRSGTGPGSTATFTFDTGSLEVGTATMAVSDNVALTGATTATINIEGGTSSFAQINMAVSIAGGVSTTKAFLNLIGGATTVDGNITKVGGIGATTATVSLSGGTLDMTGGNIGDATNLVNLSLSSGTLKNVAEINGGGGIIKTSTGMLTLSGTNTFSGDVIFSTGELKITGSGSLGVGPKTLFIQANSYLALDGSAGDSALPVDMPMTTAGLSFLNIAGANVINGAISIVAGSNTTTVTSDGGSLNLVGNIASGTATSRTLELAGTSVGANAVSGAISDGTSTVNLVKSGPGSWALTSAANTYTGSTTVIEGILSVSTPNFDNASTVSIGTSGGPLAILNLPNAGTDTVAILSIAGVDQGGGTYGNASSVLPVIATSAITGPGTIRVPGGPATPYSIWADTFLPENDVSNPTGDNDNDGLVNQQEFAFGLSAISGSSVNPILVPLNKSDGTFSYQRRAASGLTYLILTSPDLVTWPEDVAATAAQVAGPVDGNGNETVVVTLTGAPFTAPKFFVRVAAQ